jgi:hypothetical protein
MVFALVSVPRRISFLIRSTCWYLCVGEFFSFNHRPRTTPINMRSKKMMTITPSAFHGGIVCQFERKILVAVRMKARSNPNNVIRESWKFSQLVIRSLRNDNQSDISFSGVVFPCIITKL